MIKYTPQFLKKLEDILEEHGYKVRFEKGNFKSGFCIMENNKMVVINKFAAIESRINTMLEILRVIGIDSGLKSKKTDVGGEEQIHQQSLEEPSE